MGGGHGLPAQLPQCPGWGLRAGGDEGAKQDRHGCCSGLARAGRYRERSPSSGLLRGPLSYLSRPGEQCPPPPLKKQRVGSERSLPGLPAHLQVPSSMVTGRAAPARRPRPLCHNSRLRQRPCLCLLTTCSAAPGLGEGTQAERKTVRKKNPNQTHTAGSRLGCESCLWLRHGWGSAPVQDGAGHRLRMPAWHGRGLPGPPPPHRSKVPSASERPCASLGRSPHPRQPPLGLLFSICLPPRYVPGFDFQREFP